MSDEAEVKRILEERSSVTMKMFDELCDRVEAAESKLEAANVIIMGTKYLRERQTTFFDTRDGNILRECKALEKKLDKLIEDYINPGPEQATLFNT